MTLKLKHEYTAHDGSVTQIKYSKDYKHIISSGEDGVIQIWTIDNNEFVASMKGHMGSVNSFVTNNSDSQMISGGTDRSLVWWDVERQADIRRLKCHDGAINSVCLSKNLGIVFSGSTDSTVQAWDNRISSNSPMSVFSDAKDAITSVSTSRYEIFTASLDGKLRMYDVRNNKLIMDDIGSPIMHIELSWDNHAVLVADSSSRIKLQTTNTGDAYQMYEGVIIENCPIKCHFASSIYKIISGSKTGEGFIWDTKEGKLDDKIKFGEGPIIDVAANEPFTAISLGSTNGHIGIFEKED